MPRYQQPASAGPNSVPKIALYLLHQTVVENTAHAVHEWQRSCRSSLAPIRSLDISRPVPRPLGQQEEARKVVFSPEELSSENGLPVFVPAMFHDLFRGVLGPLNQEPDASVPIRVEKS